MVPETGGGKVLPLTTAEDLYSFILTKLNCSEMNEKNILLKRETKKRNPDELNKHNTYQGKRRLGISTYPVENHCQNSCRYFEVKCLSDS